ncbi:MAG: NAD-dependent epimerase/dehydratase family protein [Chloroflexota bacterium]|nr:NAD-dependent epimerase/dehydratase family protein [Chloroflexota bacterium]
MSQKLLIIGGTRNMGYYLAKQLAESGADLTLLNRGITQDDLPGSIHRLHADRSDSKQMRRALLAKRFDVVVDFVMFRQEEAETVINIFRDDVEHYIVISSGQVYLVREDLERPFHEDDYEGPVIDAPREHSYAYEEWLYGAQKREVEDHFRREWQRSKFPYTSLRLPMVNSVRDQFHRLYNYFLRLRDDGVLLVPETPNFALNHVYALDVVSAIRRIIKTGEGKGEAFNIAQDEHLSLDEFLSLMASIMGVDLHLLRVDRAELEANGFLPDCSPFSERWMSALDNGRSKEELGIAYTPLAEYLEKLVRHYQSHIIAPPLTFRRRRAELSFAEQSLQR